MNSDPTGYFTLFEVSAVISIQSQLRETYDGAILTGFSAFMDAYLGGERDPLALLSTFALNFGTGMIGGAFFGSLSAAANMGNRAATLTLAGFATFGLGSAVASEYQSFAEGNNAQGYFRALNAVGSLFGTAKAWGNAYQSFQSNCNSGICFVEGTPVLAEDGNKPIEEIEVGDYVYSTNPETGESDYKEVLQTYVNETDELVHVFVNGDEIVSTSSHPFYSPQRGWTNAVDLKAGDILVLSNGKYVTVEKVQHEILENPIKVYNFEVDDFHTYYVGDNSILVHNQCTTVDNESGTSSNRSGNIKQVEHYFHTRKQQYFLFL